MRKSLKYIFLGFPSFFLLNGVSGDSIVVAEYVDCNGIQRDVDTDSSGPLIVRLDPLKHDQLLFLEVDGS